MAHPLRVGRFESAEAGGDDRAGRMARREVRSRGAYRPVASVGLRSDDGSVNVTLLVIEGCPHAAAADAAVHAALAQADVGDVAVSRVVIRTPQDAAQWEFRGSPTVLVDGRDPFAGDAPRSYEVSCRIYRAPEGLTGTPTVQQLVDALRDEPVS